MSSKIRLLADEHVYELFESCSDDVAVDTYNPDLGIPADAGNYDALLVRTVSKVNASTLPETGNLRWVGTASAGEDHMDIAWLLSKGIAVGSAAGCNARAVAEYVITMMMVVAERDGWDPWSEKLGIVGVGHVGSALDAMCKAMSIETVLYDPPRAIKDPGFRSASIDEVLEASMLSLHLPFIAGGEWDTRYWLNEERIKRARRRLVIQASRGGIVDEVALKEALRSGWLSSAIVDVWDGEPNADPELVEMASIATPHVAGYSKQSKRRATVMALDHMQRSIEMGTHKEFQEGKNDVPPLHLPSSTPQLFNSSTLQHLSSSALGSHKGFPYFPYLDDFLIYDRELRDIARLTDAGRRATQFRQLRVKYPYRDEYPNREMPSDAKEKWPLAYFLANI
jgi:erythronate-4-phosphate dehydrogenase